ncbi:TerC family protein [Chenggangzhangella methanolivorans]|uniref:TerC family protein n=1 Tax=Chenggangzhangella methanolivorans TaxID=1437009 RepID=A0A9E6RDZ9_9HYPH|nr:TerC family protein [Chenggangzhangella methanolivorans]QZO01614.1 TerC family protein [Chenggangzhangella methanolivorans]
MLFEWIADPAAWAGLATLIVLEVVLGIDNLVFIAILADKLPEHQRDKARLLGLSLALIMRLILLASISWIVTLTETLFTVFGTDISWRDIILIVGGLFLLFKGTMELHERLEGSDHTHKKGAADAVFWQVILQIIVLDAVFSLDSVITAVGMVQQLSIMVIAVIVAMAVMMLASKPLMAFVGRHPTVVILCLGLLLMIGFSLVVEGLGFHIPKGYLYAAIGFSILIEAFNQIGRRNVRKRVTTADLRDRTADAVLRLLRGGRGEPTADDQAEVAALAEAGGGAVFSPAESSMIERVLTLGDRSVRSIMTPRREVVWLNVEDDLSASLHAARSSGRSRFPACRGEIEHVVGVVHAKDLIGVEVGRVASVAREPLYVIETMPILKLLERFRSSTVHMAIVVDEHGVLQGVVTPTDVLTAIAGELPERAADSEPDAVRDEAGVWLLDGRMSVDDAERTLGIEGMREAGDHETVAGFALSVLGHIPDDGEQFEWNGRRFTVRGVRERRIERLELGPAD